MLVCFNVRLHRDDTHLKIIQSELNKLLLFLFWWDGWASGYWWASSTALYRLASGQGVWAWRGIHFYVTQSGVTNLVWPKLKHMQLKIMWKREKPNITTHLRSWNQWMIGLSAWRMIYGLIFDKFSISELICWPGNSLIPPGGILNLFLDN